MEEMAAPPPHPDHEEAERLSSFAYLCGEPDHDYTACIDDAVDFIARRRTAIAFKVAANSIAAALLGVASVVNHDDRVVITIDDATNAQEIANLLA